MVYAEGANSLMGRERLIKFHPFSPRHGTNAHRDAGQRIKGEQRGISMQCSTELPRMGHCRGYDQFNLLVLAPFEGTVWYGLYILYRMRTRCYLWVIESLRGPDFDV